jgi:23S rRNA (uridine2552-2'-O)-methyltransferase
MRGVAMGKKGGVDRAWLSQHINDPWVKLAQKHGYRSRAAFKLSEILDEDRLLRRGMLVVDLGSAPGAWCQVLRERLARSAADGGGIDGRILALDLLPMEPVDSVEFLQGDFREGEVALALSQALHGRKADLVVSDMAPNLSGVASADSARMADLVELALDFACTHLRPEGALLAKCFHGSGYSQLVERFRRVFVSVSARKPKASRGRSAETYLLGRGLKPTPGQEAQGER